MACTATVACFRWLLTTLTGFIRVLSVASPMFRFHFLWLFLSRTCSGVEVADVWVRGVGSGFARHGKSPSPRSIILRWHPFLHISRDSRTILDATCLVSSTESSQSIFDSTHFVRPSWGAHPARVFLEFVFLCFHLITYNLQLFTYNLQLTTYHL